TAHVRGNKRLLCLTRWVDRTCHACTLEGASPIQRNKSRSVPITTQPNAPSPGPSPAGTAVAPAEHTARRHPQRVRTNLQAPVHPFVGCSLGVSTERRPCSGAPGARDPTHVATARQQAIQPVLALAGLDHLTW